MKTIVVKLGGSVLTGARVVGVKDGRKLPAKRRNQVDPLALVAGDMVVLDGNHPLAGKPVVFTCTVAAVRPAS